MRLSSIALGLTLALGLALPASAQRGGGHWEVLGETQVGFGADHDVIRLNYDENFYRNKAYRQLRFVAQGGEVKMKAIRLVYLNGYAQDLQFNRTLGPGQEIDVDLGGERSYLRQIEMFYRSKFGISLGGGGVRVNQPSIKVLAENVWRGRPEPQGGGPTGPGHDWQLLGEAEVGFRASSDVIRIGKPADWYRDRGFDKLQFTAERSDVHLISVRVVYLNNYAETYQVDRLIEEGRFLALDLRGRRSFIREIEFVSRKGSRSHGRALVQVYGDPPGRGRR